MDVEGLDRGVMNLPNQHEMPIWRHVLLRMAEAFIILYVAIDSFILPVFRPFINFLQRLRLVKKIEAFIGSLPPYCILALLGALFFVSDPLKIYGLFLAGTGHAISGAAIFVSAYIVSLALVERVFRAGEAKLRGIKWFAKILDWMFLIRDKVLRWVQSTVVWQVSQRIKHRAYLLFERWRQNSFKRVR